MSFCFGPWKALRAQGAFAVSGPTFAGISGGRTSAMMAALLAPAATLCFENTGREHPRTYDFVEALDERLGRRIVWLEFRPPARRGAPSREFGFAVVNYRTADRSGGPFEAMMEAVAEDRAARGKPPLVPWALGRVCTSYLKNRVQQHYAESLGAEAWDTFVGLRADEPNRVAKLSPRSTQRETFRMPLATTGITKTDVLAFWGAQDFDLGIEEHQGNCTGCFLKNEGDLARVLAEPETDAAWWVRMAERYPDFGGKKFPGYAQLRREGPVRVAIESALRGGGNP